MLEMRKLLPRPRLELFQLLIPSPRSTPLKHRAAMELKTPQQHHHGKEPVTEADKVVTPASMVPVKIKVVEKEPRTPKTTSSNPSPRRINTRKKKNEPTPKPSMEIEGEGSSKDVEEVEMVSSSKEPESKEDEEAEPEPKTPLLEKTRLKTRTFEWKKATPVFKTLVSTKRSTKGKMPKKGKSSQKKPRKK